MQKFIHNLALLASLIALTCGLWQDWAVWLTVQRMFISYVGFHICGSGLLLAFRAVRNDGMETANARGSHHTRKVGQ